ncbi:MAG: hypothetical protein COB59_01570 [Rhodospirillaceae bacterium]|nr:MAG: hypothetical protein COB59_01570 [Rhodospirillaceae bacterium]
MIIQAFGITDTGLRRKANEDSILVNETENIFLVADGLGGHGAGNVASAVAVDAIEEHILDYDPDLDHDLDKDQAFDLVAGAVREANARIKKINNDSNTSGRGMATTIVVALYLLKTSTLVFSHIGDSRLYRLRKGALVPLTKDHSAHQAWLDGGAIGDEPKKNVISHALGLRDTIPISVDSVTSKNGDMYVLCSDGLHDYVTDEEICQVITNSKDQNVKAICESLIEVSKKYGAPDNVTVIVIQCEQQS